MAKAEQIKALISSHLKNDGDRFVTVALQLAAHEAKQGHTALARDIRKIIDSKQKNQFVKIVSIAPELDDLVLPGESGHLSSSFVVRDELKNKLKRVVKEYHNHEKLAKYGLGNRRKILLSGPPGTGKTMTASVLSQKTRLPFYTVQIDRLITKYMGETTAKLRQIFSLIRDRRGIYLFDEFDAIGTQRGLGDDVGEMRRVLNALLQFIEGDNSNSLIIAATNSLGSLDSALFRRFDDILHYRKPDQKEIESLIRNRAGSFIGSFDLGSVTEHAEGLSHAEITQACDDSVKDAILSDQGTVTEDSLLKMIDDRKSSYEEKCK